MLSNKDLTKNKSDGRKTHPGDYSYPVADWSILKTRSLEVTRRLVERYGTAQWSRKDPLSMLVDIILSHRTKDEQTAAAYANLKVRFGSWEAMRDAPTEEVEKAIAGVNWPEIKAPRLQVIMRRISEERGELNLDFLRDWPLEQSVGWLERLPGVGPKTIACVLLFTCRKPILPVDTHVHRVSMRLGLIGPKVSPEMAHPFLQALLPQDAQTLYNFHKGLLWHGKRVCVYSRPQCANCFLTDICDYYKTQNQPPTEPQSIPEYQQVMFDF